MNDVECPYCGAEQEINHDDGYGYEEGETFNQECSSCGKTFAYTTSIIFYYDASKADCLNGGEHDFKPVTHFPRYFPDWVQCSACGCEERGEYKKPEAAQ